MMAAPRADERLRAMRTNGFRERAVDFKGGKIVGTRQLFTYRGFGTKTCKATFFRTKWPGFPENVTAVAYVRDGAKPGHTFILFASGRGVIGSLTTNYVDPTTTIPYCKGTWTRVRKIGDQPEFAKTVTFRPLDRSRPA